MHIYSISDMAGYESAPGFTTSTPTWVCTEVSPLAGSAHMAVYVTFTDTRSFDEEMVR
jgi:hypothetical protein